MSSRPIKKYGSGNVNLTIFQGDYQGQPTYSYTVQKSYKKKDGGWENTSFFNYTDLPAVRNVIDAAIMSKLRVEDIKPKEAPPAADPTSGFYTASNAPL